MTTKSNSNVIGDRMTYIVICDHKDGANLPEQSIAAMDRRSVVKAIADGQFENVVQVLCVNPAEAICDDVSKEIAWKVSEYLASEGEPLSVRQQNYIEQFLGLSVAASFSRAA